MSKCKYNQCLQARCKTGTDSCYGWCLLQRTSWMWRHWAVWRQRSAALRSPWSSTPTPPCTPWPSTAVTPPSATRLAWCGLPACAPTWRPPCSASGTSQDHPPDCTSSSLQRPSKGPAWRLFCLPTDGAHGQMVKPGGLFSERQPEGPATLWLLIKDKSIVFV